MSKIDVSKCIHYKNKTCIHDYLTTDLEFDKAKCDNSPDCYYKQLQQLKAENELLKNERTIDLRNQLEQLKATLHEIEEIVEQYGNNGIELSVEKQEQILQLIKQAKEGGE